MKSSFLKQLFTIDLAMMDIGFADLESPLYHCEYLEDGYTKNVNSLLIHPQLERLFTIYS